MKTDIRIRTPRVIFTMRLCDYRTMKAACQRFQIRQVDWLRRIIDFARRHSCPEAMENPRT